MLSWITIILATIFRSIIYSSPYSVAERNIYFYLFIYLFLYRDISHQIWLI